MRWLRRVAIGLLVLAVVLYLGFVVALYVLQRDFQYSPGGQEFSLAETGLGAEVVTISTGDGTSVTGWYEEPRAGMPVILYFKGNARSISADYERFLLFEAAGYGFLGFDYRGFPLSPGDISEAAILNDSLAAYDWLAEEGHEIVIWGRSLGSGPATYVASQREAGALLLETPFLSAVGVAAERYPIVPVGWLMQDQFRTDVWIADVEEPVFVAHGTADRTIAVSNGERLYALAPNPYDLWIVEGGTHGDLVERGLWDRAQQFFAASDAESAP